MRGADEPTERLRRAIEELAGGDVAELVAEARIEARARVRSMLTEAMAQTMLEQAREALERGPSPIVAEAARRPPARGRPPAPAPELAWYVYGVIPAEGASPPASLPGVDPEHAVTTLRHGALAAVVSQVPLEDFGEELLRERLADIAWLEHTARRHEQVLDAFRERAPLVPMRLCSIYRTESGVRQMLEREAKALEEALDHLQGKTEWGVKVFLDQSGAQGAGGPGDTGADGGAGRSGDTGAGAEGSGTAYMQRRRQKRTERQRLDGEIENACQQIHGRLCAVAVDGLTSPPQRSEVSDHAGQMILNGAYLVHDGERERFDREVQALRAEFSSLGLDLEPTGPWPAYNFVPVPVGASR